MHFGLGAFAVRGEDLREIRFLKYVIMLGLSLFAISQFQDGSSEFAHQDYVRSVKFIAAGVGVLQPYLNPVGIPKALMPALIWELLGGLMVCLSWVHSDYVHLNWKTFLL